jgi:hypothetical protein
LFVLVAGHSIVSVPVSRVHRLIGVLLFVFSSGDFAKVITTLQQPYNHMSIHALITLSIQSIKDRNNPNARKHPSSSSFRRERVEKVMKNVAGVVNEKASNLYGSLKHWASEKKKKKKGKGGARLGNDVVGGGGATTTTKPTGTAPTTKPTGTTAATPTIAATTTTTTVSAAAPVFVEEKSLFGDGGGESDGRGGGGLFGSDGSGDEDGGESGGDGGLFGNGAILDGGGVLGGGGLFD